jgi:hypothetical protein
VILYRLVRTTVHLGGVGGGGRSVHGNGGMKVMKGNRKYPGKTPSEITHDAGREDRASLPVICALHTQ